MCTNYVFKRIKIKQVNIHVLNSTLLKDTFKLICNDFAKSQPLVKKTFSQTIK